MYYCIKKYILEWDPAQTRWRRGSSEYRHLGTNQRLHRRGFGSVSEGGFGFSAEGIHDGRRFQQAFGGGEQALRQGFREDQAFGTGKSRSVKSLIYIVINQIFQDQKHYEKLRRMYTAVPEQTEVEEMEYS